MVRFTLPRDLYHGKGALEALKTLKGKKAIICVGGGSMKRFGFLQRAEDYLKEAGMEVKLFEGIESDPSVDTVMKGAKVMEEYQPDWIVAIGGGSPIDAAKAMWIKYEYPDTTFEDMCKVFGLPKLRTKAHFCAVSSTSGTATEVTAFSVITDYEKGIKYPLADFEITPDVANAIVWEIEATGGVVPQDPSTLSDPDILFPLANAEYVLSSSDDAIASITFLAATPETTGGAVWTGVEWEAREEVSETVVATAVVSGSASWTAPSIFSKVVNYQVRCRYIGVAADASPIVTAYTAYNTFSRVNLIDPAPPVYITKPSIISLVDVDGVYEVWQSYSDDRLGAVIGKSPYPASGFARAFLAVDAYAPIDAGARLSVDWQVSLSSDFSSFVINGTQTGSWFDDIEAVVYPITQMYVGQQDAFPIARNVLHYARVRYNSVDSKTSEWSDTFVYKIVNVESSTS